MNKTVAIAACLFLAAMLALPASSPQAMGIGKKPPAGERVLVIALEQDTTRQSKEWEYTVSAEGMLREIPPNEISAKSPVAAQTRGNSSNATQPEELHTTTIFCFSGEMPGTLILRFRLIDPQNRLAPPEQQKLYFVTVHADKTLSAVEETPE